MKSAESKMFDAILSATRKKNLHWTKKSDGSYHASGAIEISIREICPLIAGETETIGVQGFELELNRVILTFWSGTDGQKKIHQILSAGIPESDHHSRHISAQIEEAISQLDAAAKKGNRPKKAALQGHIRKYSGAWKGASKLLKKTRGRNI